MKVLLIGSGGREHALAKKISESRRLTKLFVLPGNPGIASLPLTTCLKAPSIDDNPAIVKLAQEKQIELAVIGPEAPLANGLTDALTEVGIKVFGPSAAAAKIESSKQFAKDLMHEYHIPTADYAVFADAEEAKNYVKTKGAPIVVKADGLAAGKGVVVAQTVAEATEAIDGMMSDKNFGAAGEKIVIEEFMEGEEASLLAFVDGTNVVPMLPAQDHKRAYDGDQGANTGGMGAYAPAPLMTPELIEETLAKILRPTVAALAEKKCPYRGCLYAGLMITAQGPKVVEFNARFGDPETQVVLPLLKSDLLEIMLSCAGGSLAQDSVEWHAGSAACVIMAAGGYPGKYAKGDPIAGLAEAEKNGCTVFQAGTAEKNGSLVTNGGRVLGVTAVADNLRAAVDKAYDGVKQIQFNNVHYRHDIAHRALPPKS